MPAFSSFDTRGYPTVSAREGYRIWSPSYEETVKEDMDTWLLEQVRTVAWTDVRRAADLGCGTGRTGSWLKSHRVQRIEVDPIVWTVLGLAIFGSETACLMCFDVSFT